MRAELENNQYDEQRSASSAEGKAVTVQRSSALEDNRSQTEVVRQLKSMANTTIGNDVPVQLQAGNQSADAGQSNDTGLPSQIKAGVESLSGQSMDDVKVHYNSDKPAQLQAHAYAQGTDIHVAPGQDQHLPHEAWHVVQQKQGRVKPTTQLKGKVNINDDPGLEREADIMGAKALSTDVQTQPVSPAKPSNNIQLKTIQREETEDGTSKSFEASVESDMLILRGDRSWWGRLTGSQFTLLYEAIEKLGTAAPDDKPALIEEIHTMGQKYLDTHVDSDDNDKTRRASIKRIVAGIGRFKSDSDAAAKALSIASTDDKVGIGAKLKKAIFGEDTPFVQAVKAFTEYQNQTDKLATSDSAEGFNFLKGVFANAKKVEEKVAAWNEKHAGDQSSDDLSDKRGIIKNMKDKLGVINVNLKFKHKNLFQFTGEQVKINPLNKDLTIASIKVNMLGDVPAPLKDLAAEAKDIRYTDEGFDFSQIDVTKPPETYEPFTGLKLTSPPSIILKKNGGSYTLEIGETGINIVAGKLFEGEARASGIFKYESGASHKVSLVDQLTFTKISVALKEEVPSPVQNLAASVYNFIVKSEGNSFSYDFSKIKLTATPKPFEPFTGLILRSPQSMVIRKESDVYRIKVGNSGIGVDAGGYFTGDAYGSAEFVYSSAKPDEFNFVQGVHLNEVNGKLGNKFHDSIEGLSVKGVGISIKPQGDSYDTDFKQITVTAKPKDFTPFDGPITVSAPNEAIITGPKAKYKVLFKGAKAEAQFGKEEGAQLKAKGKADFYWDHEKKKGIEAAELDAEGKSPTMPGELPFWPLEFGFDAALPVPGVTVGISLEAGGGAFATIGGKINYDGKNERIDATATAGLTGNVHASIKLGAGVGHKWIAYVGLFAKATAKAEAIGTATLEGYFTKPGTSYELQKADLKYHLAANLKGNISAGAEAKALVFYQRTLFEIKSADWDIASTSRDGTFNLLNNTEKPGATGEGLLVDDKSSINKEIPADNRGSVDDSLKDISQVGADSPQVKMAREIVEILSADGMSLGDPELINALSTKVDLMKSSMDALDLKLSELMPSKLNPFANEKKKDIIIARQLLGEVRFGHLVNFSQEVMKQSPEVITYVLDFTGSLSRIMEIVAKYDK